LADEAVSCEPVSGPNSLITKEDTGNFAISAFGERATDSKILAIARLFHEIPCATEQGICMAYQGTQFAVPSPAIIPSAIHSRPVFRRNIPSAIIGGAARRRAFPSPWSAAGGSSPDCVRASARTCRLFAWSI
jgi:hypothetical protein